MLLKVEKEKELRRFLLSIKSDIELYIDLVVFVELNINKYLD